VKNPDDGEYKLIFTNPKDFKRTQSRNIKAKASSSDFRNAIRYYYRAVVGRDPEVKRTRLNAGGQETDKDSETVTYQYDIT